MLRYIKDRTDQLRITKSCHVDPTSGHLGIMKTGNRIKERFMWKGIWADVKEMVIKLNLYYYYYYSGPIIPLLSFYFQVSKCDECQKMNKAPLVVPTVLHPVPVHSPWYHVGIDFVGPIHPTSTKGNRFILTISDYFTKWVEAIPLPSKCSLGVAKSLFKVYIYYNKLYYYYYDNKLNNTCVSHHRFC